MLFAAWKDKKALTAIWRNAYVSNICDWIIETIRKNKEHLRLVISSIRVGVLAKTYDEIYILSTIKIYSFHLFSPLRQGRSSCWIYQKWCSFFENCYRQAKMVEKKRIIFLVSPYWTLLFSRKEHVKISITIVSSAALWLREDVGLEKIPILQRIFTCRKRQLKHWNKM